MVESQTGFDSNAHTYTTFPIDDIQIKQIRNVENAVKSSI